MNNVLTERCLNATTEISVDMILHARAFDENWVPAWLCWLHWSRTTNRARHRIVSTVMLTRTMALFCFDKVLFCVYKVIQIVGNGIYII